MSRFDITLGLLASILTIAVLALYGAREETRMQAVSEGYEHRSEETGAQLFDQYCRTCHGPNASGAQCPPLNEKSGLHGGDMGAGVACRLEEVGWLNTDTYGYVFNTIQGGRQYSTRPDRYPGNRPLPVTPTPGGPTPEPTDLPLMAMPAWGQRYGGPLRDDQIGDIAHYIVAFSRALPEDPEDAKALACGPNVKSGVLPTATGGAATPSAAAGETGTPGTPGTPGTGTAPAAGPGTPSAGAGTATATSATGTSTVSSAAGTATRTR